MLCQKCCSDFEYKQVTCPKKYCEQCRIIVNRDKNRIDKQNSRIRKILNDES